MRNILNLLLKQTMSDEPDHHRQDGMCQMKIQETCNLVKMYENTNHRIDENSPELLFIKAVCAGQEAEALSFFRERKLFSDEPPAIDTPYGRFAGLDEIRDFVKDWLQRFNAQSAYVTPVIQTIANGRIGLEAAINFETVDSIEQVPMFIIADLRTPDLLDEIRIYCHFSYVPGLQAYRHPIFKAAHLEMGEPSLLTGAVREYYEALHHVPAVDVDRIMKTFGEGCQFGGYDRKGTPVHQAADREELRAIYERMSLYIPRCVGMRYETIIDDGRTCIIEWVHIVSRAGQDERARIAMSGIAAYERGDNGLLCSVRISDYAGSERTIDWSQLEISEEEAKAVNFVEVFPAGVGQKPQS